MSVLALIATANTVLLLLVAASRSVYGMAAAGAMPGRLASVGKGGTPWVASVAIFASVVPLVLIGELGSIAKPADAAVLVPFLFVNLALFLGAALAEAWRGTALHDRHAGATNRSASVCTAFP